MLRSKDEAKRRTLENFNKKVENYRKQIIVEIEKEIENCNSMATVLIWNKDEKLIPELTEWVKSEKYNVFVLPCNQQPAKKFQISWSN